MHYAVWAFAYLAVSFTASVGIGKLIAFGSADLPEPVPARIRAQHRM